MGDKVDRFGQLLRECRRRALLSQQQLAESSGVSDRTIRNLERGTVAAPRVTTAHMLASALRLEGEQHEAFVEAATAQRAGRNGEEATPGPMRVDAELETLSGSARLALPRAAQLPMAASGFAGRRSELAALDAAWLSARQHDRGAVAAVVGGAGIGKTTLAVEWAHRHKAAFPDGQLFVDMQAFSGGDGGLPLADVLSNCLESLGVPAHRVPASPQMRTSLYRTITADLRLLVLIDNVTSAGDIRALIPSSPTAMTIVTGRQDLEGLTIREGGAPIVVDVMATDDALDLLGKRLAGRSPALPLDALHAVAQACGRLPLALAIAGARLAGTRSEDLHAVVHEITHAADLGPFRADDADSDIRTVFSWSYRALPADA
ncbi:helix-turn-helix domain-containing protein, partial [Actinoplanes sp. NPDC051633]|uniref:helix-turn-helix domain-containing protein n=1 Tax=Actinoplanes sp. NPDC051633 TaxID=3155670 RepID=UPI0034401C12